MGILNEKILVLNKFWQAINMTNVEKALPDLYKGTITAVWDDPEGILHPLSWDEWLEVPIRDTDKIIRSKHLKVVIPQLIIAENYQTIPKAKPNLENKNIALRDKFICQYTGKYCPNGNVDHVIPLSRNGRHCWTNVVWCDTTVNAFKGPRTPEEAGLKLIKQPKEPLAVPIVVKIPERQDKPLWKKFSLKGMAENTFIN